ncbi:DUF3618 domain-containing protein [Nocardioides sp.]|jgi:hypothetical protein|uniref:DUF3618 domain-containing protein n=1 Tax=Nocardioides sp. TaxID=35761 RepID=UPI002F3FC48A
MTENTELEQAHSDETAARTEDRDLPTGGDDRGNDPSSRVVELEADIERTREDLAQTVDRLAEKLDVKTRARNRMIQTRDEAAWRWRTLRNRATDAQGNPDPVTIGAGGGVLAALVAVLVVALWRRNQTSRRSRRRR